MIESVVLVDAHVHFHPVANVATLLDAATSNFQAEAARLGARAWQGALLLTEMAGVDRFGEFVRNANPTQIGDWSIVPGGDEISVLATRKGKALLIVAGRQMATREGLEVLALGTRAQIEDRQALPRTILLAQQAGAVVVLPWAAGKWLGERGKLVERALIEAEGSVFPGDNSGRPSFWKAPAVFATLARQGRAVLPGTDPLPLKGEEARVGRNGFWMSGKLPAAGAGAALLQNLREAQLDAIHAYGPRETPWGFVRNQVALRLAK